VPDGAGPPDGGVVVVVVVVVVVAEDGGVHGGVEPGWPRWWWGSGDHELDGRFLEVENARRMPPPSALFP
jgi:hypothetical protein